MKTIIHNTAHKHIRIPEQIYIIRHASQWYGWQNLTLIGPSLDKIFNHLTNCIMKQKTKVSETVPAGEVAVENVILSNYSNSNKMSTTKKVSSKLLVLFAAFLMAAGVVNAKEKAVKVADATEVVNTGNEVKPVILVSIVLEKGSEIGPGKDKKDSVVAVVKVPLKSALVKVNTKAKALKRTSSHHYVAKNGKVYDDLVWFPALEAGCTNPSNPSNYNTSAGVQQANSPGGCTGTLYCCSIGYPASDCHFDGTYWILNSSPASTPTIRGKDE